MKLTLFKNLNIRLQHQNQIFLAALLFLIFSVSLPSPATSEDNGATDQKPNLFDTGVASYHQGDYQGNIQTFREILRSDPENDRARLNLVRLLKETGKYQEAISVLTYLTDKYPSESVYRLALMETAYLGGEPNFEANQCAVATEKRKISTPPTVRTITAGRDSIPEVRIGLMEKVQELYIKTGNDFRIAERNVNTAITGKYNTVLLVRQSSAEIEVCDEDGQILIRSSKPLLLSYQDPEAATILFGAQYGQGNFWAGRQDRAYRGNFEFTRFDQGLTVVNRVNVEEYLYAVVPSEVPSSWPKAVLEAQAIAARTYTFANLGRFETRGFDLLSTVVCQVYNGVQAETDLVREAVDSTRGLISTYQSRPIGAFSYDNCGGYTESSQNIWGFSSPYLQAVPDKLLPPRNGLLAPAELYSWLKDRPEAYSNHPEYSARSAYRWTLWVSREEIETCLKLTEKIGRILSLSVVERSISGRAVKVLIKGTNGEKLLKGELIRSLGGLRSTLFVVQPKLGADGLPEQFVFNGIDKKILNSSMVRESRRLI